MRPLVKAKGVYGASLASLALLATACGCTAASDSAAEEGRCGGETIEVGINNAAGDAVLFIAQARGYFDEEGITPEFVEFDSASKMIAPLGSGQLDIGVGAPSAGFFNAVSSGVDLRIVADKGSMPEGHGYMPVLVRKDLVDSGEVSDASDLAGRIVAEPGQGATSAPTLNAALSAEDVSYTDVEHEYLGFPEHITAFDNKAIDASVTTEPSAAQAIAEGVAVPLVDSSEIYPGQQVAVVLYNGEFAEADRDVGECFMRAYLQGARDYTAATEGGAWEGEDADDLLTLVAEEIGLEEEVLGQATPPYIHPDGEVNLDSLTTDYEFYRDQGWLDEESDVAELVDTSFAEDAVEELGPYSDTQ